MHAQRDALEVSTEEVPLAISVRILGAKISLMRGHSIEEETRNDFLDFSFGGQCWNSW